MSENSASNAYPDDFDQSLAKAEKGVVEVYRSMVLQGDIKEITPDDILSGFELSCCEEETSFGDQRLVDQAEYLLDRNRTALATLFASADTSPVGEADILNPRQIQKAQSAAMSVCPRESALNQATLILHDRAYSEFKMK